MRPPDLLTPEEEKQLSQIIENQVDFWQESKGLHEVVQDAVDTNS